MNEEDLAIDPHQLDEELMKQPVLFEFVAKQAGMKQHDRDKCKIDLEEIKAKIEKEIRADPVKYGIEKVTEGSIKAAIVLDEHVLKAERLLAFTNFELATFNNHVKAVEMKKKALENMVQLYIGQYFSVPNEKHELNGGKRILDKIAEKGEEKHIEKLKENSNKRRSRLSNKSVGEVYDDLSEGAKEAMKGSIERTEPELAEELNEHIEKPVRRRRRRR